MLFPEKLDVDKKGRPSTAGSKIKVGWGEEEELGRVGGRALGTVLYPFCRLSLMHPGPPPPAPSVQQDFLPALGLVGGWTSFLGVPPTL